MRSSPCHQAILWRCKAMLCKAIIKQTWTKVVLKDQRGHGNRRCVWGQNEHAKQEKGSDKGPLTGERGQRRDGYQHDLLAVTAKCVSGVTASSHSCPPPWTIPEVTCRVYLKLVPSTSSSASYITLSLQLWLTPPGSSVWLPVAVFVKPVSWCKQPCCESRLCHPLWKNREQIFMSFLLPTAADRFRPRASELWGNPVKYDSNAVSEFVFCLPASSVNFCSTVNT